MKYLLFVLLLSLVGAGCIGAAEPNEVPSPSAVEEEAVVEEVVPDDPGPTVVETQLETDAPEAIDGVLAHYYAIPDSYLVAPLSKEERELSIDVLDEENYYLTFMPRTWEGSGQLAIFLGAGGQQYAVLVVRGCGPLCEEWVYVLEYVNGNWMDRTAAIWPDLTAPEATIASIRGVHVRDNPSVPEDDVPFVPLTELPRHGVTVRAYDQFTGYVYAHAIWNGSAFSIERITSIVESIHD